MTKPHDSSQSETDADQAALNRLLLDGLAPLPLPPERQTSLRQGLLSRVAGSVAEQAGLLTVRSRHGSWQSLTAGIRVKPLWNGPEGNSVLLEFAPGARLLSHRHNWLEEGIVLRGRLQMGDLDLGPLDYHVSPPGSRHGAIGSRQGALAYLRGTSLGDTPEVLKEVLGGLLPFGNDASQTFFARNDNWLALADGVTRKELWQDDRRASYFYRLQPGASVPAHDHAQNEECMVLSGDVFLGDTLLRAGDYQLAPAGTRHGPVHSDVGSVLFVRGARIDNYPSDPCR